MKPKKWELLLVLGLVFGLCLWAFFPKNRGGTAAVTVDGELFGAYDLNEPRRQTVSGYDGFSLTLVIEDGTARVEHSTCPDLICQNHAPISNTGEQIICLPGRVVIAITKADREGEIDAVTG